MKKKLLTLALAVAMVVSLNAVVNAGPGVVDDPGITPGGPRSLSITICLEDN